MSYSDCDGCPIKLDCVALPVPECLLDQVVQLALDFYAWEWEAFKYYCDEDPESFSIPLGTRQWVVDKYQGQIVRLSSKVFELLKRQAKEDLP